MPKIFGTHLLLAGILCFGFGFFHVTGLFGSGIWVSDPYGLTGNVQPVSPAWGPDGFDPYNPGGLHKFAQPAFDTFVLSLPSDSDVPLSCINY